MPETEQDIVIGGYLWTRIPSNQTCPYQTYSEEYVRQCGGNPAVVQGQWLASTERNG